MPTYDGFGAGWVVSVTDPRLIVLWPGSEDHGEDLEFVLHVAKVQCEAYAPAIGEYDVVPENYVAAQILQARALLRAGVAGNGDQTGGYGETVTVFPMDWTVKALLRPKKARPHFGSAV